MLHSCNFRTNLCWFFSLQGESLLHFEGQGSKKAFLYKWQNTASAMLVTHPLLFMMPQGQNLNGTRDLTSKPLH